jgi:hypothetical protein
MPPISPQGSRTGLISAVVAFVVLFVTATIFAIYFGVAANKAEEDLTTKTAKMQGIAKDITNPDVVALSTQAKLDKSLTEPTALALAMKQKAQLLQLTLGTPRESSTTQPADAAATDATVDALGKAKDALAAAAGKLGPKAASIKLASTQDDLVGAVGTLTDAVTALNDAVTASGKAQEDASNNAATQIKAAQLQVATAQKSVATLDGQLKAAQAKNVSDLAAKDDDIKKINETIAAERQSLADQITTSDKAKSDAEDKAKALQLQVDKLVQRLAQRRGDVSDPIVRRPDGKILRVASTDTVYIDLGQGDQLHEGMTFEVYDKHTPIPKLGDGLSDDNMPVGKGSLEVVHIGTTSTECHVVKIEHGQVLTEGDPVVNLVYDRNTHYKFFVYGDFDTDRNGVATPQEADVIKRLITSWGGQVQNTIDVDTDFVVMGQEPVLPDLPKDSDDPFLKKKYEDAKAALDVYEDWVNKAKELSIPIMNQNRFLYYCGYYDLATR